MICLHPKCDRGTCFRHLSELVGLCFTVKLKLRLVLIIRDSSKILSFICLISRKQNRIRRMCTHDIIVNESVELHNILLRNRYSDKFIQINLKYQPRTKTPITATEKIDCTDCYLRMIL